MGAVVGWRQKVDGVCPRVSQLLPVMSDLEYLQDQHLLLSVKSCDGFESYGQSVRTRTAAT